MSNNSNHGASIATEIRLLCEARAAFFRILLCKPSSANIQFSNQVLGAFNVRCQNIEFITDMAAFPTPVGACEILNITNEGLVHIESRFSTAIVSRLLGMPPPILPRSLSRVERGVLGCVVASILSDLGISFGLELQKSEAPSLHLSKVGFSFQLQVSTSDLSGTVYCIISQHALEAAWQNGYLASLFLSRTVPCTLELARSSLSQADAAALCVGDAIIFEDAALLSESKPWPVTLNLLDIEIPAILGLDGDLHLKTTSEMAFELQQERQPGDSFLLSQTDQLEEGFRAFANDPQASPLELIIEVALPPLASDSLWLLFEGETIPLGISRRSRVLVRAGKLSPVPGELIVVDGMLAVRIIQKWRALLPIDQTTLPLSTI
jgi:hypothetical protein